MRITLFFCLLLTALIHQTEAASRPNIIFIYSDDMRWDSSGFVQQEMGDKARFPWLKTPHIDNLAQHSFRFRNSYVVTSLCSPGRAGVMTSKYGHLNGVYNNGTPLPAHNVTFAQHLQKAGYKTGYFGKWHMSNMKERPGFDEYASFIGQGKYNDCPLLINGQETPTTGWVDDVTSDYAVKFIQKQTTAQPYFVWMGFKSPHGPRGGNNLPERARNLYANESSKETPNTSIAAIYNPNQQPPRMPTKQENLLDFHRHISAIDDCIGKIMDAVKASGQDENTMVMLTSDNGYYLGEHGLGDKRTAYDESLRVPLFIRTPGQNRSAKTIDQMVLNIDYAPTILEYAQAAPLPEAQGRSLAPLLKGESPKDWRKVYFYEYFQERSFPQQPTTLGIRTETHKYMIYPGHPEWSEIFDLQHDPYETSNLISDSKLKAELEALFLKEQAAVKFSWPTGYTAEGDTPFKTDADDTPKPRKKKQKEE